MTNKPRAFGDIKPMPHERWQRDHAGHDITTRHGHDEADGYVTHVDAEHCNDCGQTFTKNCYRRRAS